MKWNLFLNDDALEAVAESDNKQKDRSAEVLRAIMENVMMDTDVSRFRLTKASKSARLQKNGGRNDDSGS